jgi:HSP20 family protein
MAPDRQEVCDDDRVMHSRSASYSELWEFRAELLELFQTLEPTPGTDPLRTDYAPAMDVYETDASLEVAVDLPGVSASSVRVFVRSAIMLIAGQKSPRRGQRDASFHLVERGFGRFARTLALAGPCDAARATATFASGELRVSLPKVGERRGRTFAIPIGPGQPPSAGDRR